MMRPRRMGFTDNGRCKSTGGLNSNLRGRVRRKTGVYNLDLPDSRPAVKPASAGSAVAADDPVKFRGRRYSPDERRFRSFLTDCSWLDSKRVRSGYKLADFSSDCLASKAPKTILVFGAFYPAKGGRAEFGPLAPNRSFGVFFYGYFKIKR